MEKTIFILRSIFVAACALGAWLVCYSVPEWDQYWLRAIVIGALIGLLVVLVDMLLKGFSLRGLTAITFGLACGGLVAFLIGSSPLFERGEPEVVFLARMALFLICSYIGAVLALRGRDEFNLIIPYVRFVPHDVESPLIVVDTSALIDGRVVKLCETGWISSALVIPRFVLRELQRVADSSDPVRQARGRRGLEALNQLRRIKGVEIRIHEAEVAKPEEIESKLVYLAQTLKAKLLTTDYNLSRLAEFHGVRWLNLGALAKSVSKEWIVGEKFAVELVKPGRDEGQAVGYLPDGSMVVVTNGRGHIGKRVAVEVVSLVPTAGGKIIFARSSEAVEEQEVEFNGDAA